jgi:hypothetical protein
VCDLSFVSDSAVHVVGMAVVAIVLVADYGMVMVVGMMVMVTVIIFMVVAVCCSW